MCRESVQLLDTMNSPPASAPLPQQQLPLPHKPILLTHHGNPTGGAEIPLEAKFNDPRNRILEDRPRHELPPNVGQPQAQLAAPAEPAAPLEHPFLRHADILAGRADDLAHDVVEGLAGDVEDLRPLDWNARVQPVGEHHGDGGTVDVDLEGVGGFVGAGAGGEGSGRRRGGVGGGEGALEEEGEGEKDLYGGFHVRRLEK